MALFQPSNITPSTFAGIGGGTVDVNNNVNITWQINGNSVMIAFQVVISSIDSNGTATTVKTITVSDLAVYPTDAKGNTTFYSYEPQVTWASWGLTNGNTYTLQITQYWQENGMQQSVEQFSVSEFYTRSTPTLAFNPIGTNNVVNTVSYTISATYEQAQGDVITWARWQFAEIINGVPTLIEDTGEINTILLQYIADGLQSGKTYGIICSIQTENGVEVATNGGAWTTFGVSYALEQINAQTILTATSEYNALNWQVYDLISNIPGVANGNYTIYDYGGIILPNNVTVTWETQNNAALNIESPWSLSVFLLTSAIENNTELITINNTYTISGNLILGTQSSNKTLTGITNQEGLATGRITSTTGYAITSASVTYKSNNTREVNLTIATNGKYVDYQIVNYLPSSQYTVQIQLVYSKPNYEFTLKKNNTVLATIQSVGLTISLTPTTFSVGDVSASFSDTQSNLQSLTVGNGISINSIAVVSGNVAPTIEPTWDNSSVVMLATFDNVGDNALQAGQINDVEIRSDLYVSKNGGLLTKLYSFPVSDKAVFINDYGWTINNTYEYWLYAVLPQTNQYVGAIQFAFADGVKSIIRQQQPFYLLIESIADEDNPNVFHVVQSWKFGNNINASNVTNNNSPSWLQNFTGYDLKQPSSQRGRSGTLQALLSNVENGVYYDSPSQMDTLWAASLSTNIFFLKDMKGNLYMVSISAPITQTINTATYLQQVTVSLPWKEIGDASGISLIQTVDDINN